MIHPPSPASKPIRICSLVLIVFLLCGVLSALAPAAALAQGEGWNLPAGSIVHTASISADGHVVVGSRDGLVLYLDRSGKELWRYDAKGTVLGLGISLDGKRIIAATEARSALLLDGSGNLLWKKDYDYALIGAAISGDGNLIGLIPRQFKTVWVLDGAGNDLWSKKFDVAPSAVAISPDGKRVAFGMRDAWVKVFDQDGNADWQQQMNGVIRGIAFSDDGAYIAVGDESDKGYLLAGDLPAGAGDSIRWSYDTGDKVLAAAISGDGTLVAFGSNNQDGYLLDDKGVLVSKHATGGPVNAAALSPDGSLLVFGSTDRKAYGFGVKQMTAGYAAGQQRTLILAIVIPLIVLVLVGALAALLRWTPLGQRVWQVQGKAPRRLVRDIWRAKLSYLLLLPTVALLLVFNYYPAVSGLAHSFTQWNPGISTKWVGLDNFVAIRYDTFLRIGVVNALILILTGFAKLALPLLVAELLFHLRSRTMQYWLRSLFIFPIVVPGVAIILIWRNIFDPNIGLVNNVLSLVGWMNMRQPQAWLGDPHTAIWSIVFIGFPWVGAFALLLFYGGLISIPVELFDAAKVDGASGPRRFWNLDLPLLMSQIKLLVILGFIGGVQEFALIYLTTEGGPFNATYVPALELYYQAMRFSNFGLASAIGTVLFIVILGGTVLNLRYVRSATEYEA